MMVSCKRAVTTEELLEPFMKRSRLHDVCMSGPEPACWAVADDAMAAAAARDTEVVAAAAVAMAEAERRRLLPSCDVQEDQPALKRLRKMFEGMGAHAATAVPDGTANREASIRHWSEGLVKSLHGCPSVEAAAQRCTAVLSEFETEVRQATLREADQARATSEEAGSTQSLQHSNKVLLRAVHHLAERCRRLEDGSREEEIQSLRQALEQSQDAQRRLQHSNEVLQEHIKIHLNACRAGGF
eukprot:TRINITY_DN23180_c0_g1_i1.p1 TRINITY_DN23180_c0_g1~~TRINITY_DN23180_c0_g1_i1.p1  ORF type:complete len:242 (-),score=66.64 TRINITY_DN23180_c0_g1_i1:77-802(-)